MTSPLGTRRLKFFFLKTASGNLFQRKASGEKFVVNPGRVPITDVGRDEEKKTTCPGQHGTKPDERSECPGKPERVTRTCSCCVTTLQELDGRVTPARLREAAGGGGYNRLKAIVEAWRVRRVEAAKRTGIEAREIEARERDGRDTSPTSRKQGRRRTRDDQAAAKTGAPSGGDRIAPEIVTLGDLEQAEIAMEAGRVKAVLAGGEARPTETPGEPEAPSSIEQAEADVAAVLRAATGHEGDDKPAASGSGKEEGAKLSAGLSEAAPADPAVAAPSSSAPAEVGAGAGAEIARLQAHVEDLRRENGMLWDQVKHEREARIREIELLNGMIQAMRR